MTSEYKKHLNEEVLSPGDFINEYIKGKKKIEKSVILPPRIGTPGFGKILVSFGVSKNDLPQSINDILK